MRPNDGSQSRPAPTAGAAATVAISAQGDRSVLTPHTLTATMGGGATSVAWTSATGTFDNAASLTPTYTPTTIGAQEVTCTPTGPLGAGAPDGEGWAVSRPLPVAANATISTVVATLALQTEALSDTASADGVTWSTVVQRYTTSNTLEGTESVTGSTTTGPTWTPSALDKVYRVTSTATDAYGRTSATVRAVSAAVASATDLTVSLSTGATVNQASPAGQVITATPTGGTGSKSYAWTATYINTGADAVALLSASTGNPVTLTTDAYSQRVMVVCTATDSGSPAQVAVAAVGVVVAISPIVFSTPTAQSATVAGAASITFVEPSGGTPSYSYSGATLTKPAGSAASLSGSGLGAYTFTTDLPGSYSVVLTVTDAVGVTQQATGVVTYAPTGPTWIVVDSEDFTASDSTSRTTAGTLTLSSGRALTAYFFSTAAGTFGNTAGSGLYVTQSSGTGALWLSLTPTTPTADKKIAVQVLAGAQDVASATQVQFVARLTDVDNWYSGGANKSLYMYHSKPGNYKLTCGYMSATTPVEGSMRDSASPATYPACYTIVMDGTQATFYVHFNVSTFVPMDSILDGSPIEKYTSTATTVPGAYARMFVPNRVAFGTWVGTASVNNIKGFRLLEATRQ